MADLSQDSWREQLSNDKNAVVLDVRTTEELEDGFIPKAIHLDIYQGQDFMDKINKLDKNKSYYVYCKSGGRSGQACAIMSQLGFKNAYNLVGGIMQWTGEVVNN